MSEEKKKIKQMAEIWEWGVCYCPSPEKLEGNLCGRCGGKINPKVIKAIPSD